MISSEQQLSQQPLASNKPHGFRVEWTDLDLHIPVTRPVKTKWGTRQEKHVLHVLKNLSGVIEPGRLTAICAPSGGGKTTLLNALAGRASKDSIEGCTFTGQVSLSGVKIDPVKERSQFAYVLSEDAMDAFSTPEESIRFAINLRRPELSDEAKQKKIDFLIDDLGIRKCKDTYVGNELVKGVSSGERKRTAVGIELVHEPGVLFLDEPTTGLDSFTAFQIVSMMKKLAHEGRCVLSTIHQPSSETFALFDDVIFMVKGAIVYHGPVGKVREHFGNLGFVCPEKYNICDYVMGVMQKVDEQDMEKLVNAWLPAMQESRNRVLATVETTEQITLPAIKMAERKLQFNELAAREGRKFIRDVRLLQMRLLVPLFLTLLIGGVLYKQGLNAADDQGHIAAVTFIGIQSMMLSAQPLILSFPYERPVFIREYSGGMYDVYPYFLSRSVFEIPVIAVQILISVTIAYFMTQLQGNFGIIYAGAFMNGLSAAGLVLAVSATAKTPKEAVEKGPLVFMPQMLFAGLWIRISLIPVWMRWIQWCVPFKYAMGIIYYGEFDGLDGGEAAMNTNDFYSDMLWFYFMMLAILIFVFRALCVVVLKNSAKKTVY
jgi:ABC-type multidrug transport system ATPase subunit/ABC-type multidrug transport system permease subunit